MALLRGAKPTSPERIAAATPFVPKRRRLDLPLQFIRIPDRPLSFWGNDVFGDCVTAEEFFAKACDGADMGYHKAVTWARNHWQLNGAGIWEVLTLMQTSGIYDGNSLYLDGPFKYVDFTDADVLKSAIVEGTVKLGVAGDQLEGVPNIGNANGWIATNFTEDTDLDHCTSLCGYGPMAWLAGELGGTVPAGVSGSTAGYAMFTWSSIGIIDVPSMLAITGEAWLRSPTTIVKPNPVPATKPTTTKPSRRP